RMGKDRNGALPARIMRHLVMPKPAEEAQLRRKAPGGPPPPPANAGPERARRAQIRLADDLLARQAVAGRAFGRAAADKEDRDDGFIAQGWAPVRVFPVPHYARGYDGPRTDFRETIYWNGNVATGADGNAEVAFAASDAITSFRATAEGVSAGGV